MDLLNVKYEISYSKGLIEQRKTYLPRAFLVPDYKILKKEQMLDYFNEADFDPTNVVLFEEGGYEPSPPRKTKESSAMQNQVDITSYSPDQITLSVTSAMPSFLFLSEMYYPGWKAFVDGQATRILKGNYMFRVIEIPEGKHNVTFIFDPLSIKMGIGVTTFTLFMLLVLVVWSKRKHHRATR